MIESMRVGECVLAIDQITKVFWGLVALDGVSFRVEKGEIMGLIGPNGSGKSTLFEVCSGFYRPTRGQVLFKGERIDRLPPHEVLKRGLGRSFQGTEVFPSFTAYDTILLAALHRWPMAQARKRVQEVLNLIGLMSRAEQLVSSMTLPDKKAVELGRVIATGPEMLLLDEVMAGLTEPEAQAVIAVIRKLQEEGLTFLLVEHRMEIVMDLCDRIVVLNFGKKIAEGKPHEMVRNKDVIEAYLGV